MYVCACTFACVCVRAVHTLTCTCTWICAHRGLWPACVYVCVCVATACMPYVYVLALCAHCMCMCYVHTVCVCVWHYVHTVCVCVFTVCIPYPVWDVCARAYLHTHTHTHTHTHSGPQCNRRGSQRLFYGRHRRKLSWFFYVPDMALCP